MQKKITTNQADIFQQLENDPLNMEQPEGCVDLDIQNELRGAASKSLKLARQQGMSREHVVDEMNRLLPELPKTKQITLRKLNAWLATSKEDSEFPLRFVPAFCAATRTDLLMRVAANAIQKDLSDMRELLAQEFGEIELQRAALARKAKSLKAKFSG